MSINLRRFLASDKFLDSAKNKVEEAIQEANGRGLPKAYNDDKYKCEIVYEKKCIPRFAPNAK